VTLSLTGNINFTVNERGSVSMNCCVNVSGRFNINFRVTVMGELT
jgi:hypothetical protein